MTAWARGLVWIRRRPSIAWRRRKPEIRGSNPRGPAMFLGFRRTGVRVKSKCLVVHGLSLFVIIDGFSTIPTLEGFSKYSRVYGSYKLYKLKYIGCTFTI